MKGTEQKQDLPKVGEAGETEVKCYLMASGQMIVTSEEEAEEGIYFRDPFTITMMPQSGGRVGCIMLPISGLSSTDVFGPVNFAGVLFEVPLTDALVQGYLQQVQELRARRSGLTLARNIPDLSNMGDLGLGRS